jgi:hypothetical protein
MISTNDRTISEAIKDLEAKFESLSPNQVTLIKSFKKYFKRVGFLSERQTAVLFDMWKYLAV